MPILEMTPDEKNALLAILERYYPSLLTETSRTDDRDYRKDLEKQEKCMARLIDRIKKISDS